MKFIWITDIHLSEKTIETVRAIWLQTLKYGEKEYIGRIVLGGDIFDSRFGQPQSVLDAFEEMLDESLQYEIPVLAIPGNHDKTDYTSEKSFLIPFRTHPVFELVDSYEKWEMDKWTAHFIPFFDEKLAYGAHLEKAVAGKKKGDNVLFTHIAAEGAKNNDGSKVESGLKVNDLFDLTVIGHYHDTHWASENVFYTGSAYQANFGEDDKKGIWVFDGQKEMKDCMNFVQLDFPKYHTLESTRDGLMEGDLTDTLEGMINNGAHVRIVVEDNSPLSKEITARMRSMGVRLERKKISDQQLEKAVEVIEFNPSQLLEYFDIWAKEAKPNGLLTGRKILKEACGL